MEDDNNTWHMWCKIKVQPFLFKHCLMLGIMCILVIGLALPQPGEYVDRFKGSNYICVIMIFLHTGLKLRTAEVKSAVANYRAFIWGILSTLLFSALVGSKLTQLLPFGDPVSITSARNSSKPRTSIVGPGEFQIGLELYFISPCAIATGIVLVGISKGDVPVAILLTVTTNFLGVFTVPVMAKWLLTVKHVQVDMVKLLMKLVLTVLLPLLVGKALTMINYVKEFVKNYTKTLKVLSILFLICIPWMKISKAKLSGLFAFVSVLSIFINLLWIMAMHILFLIMNYSFARILCFSLEIRKTVVILLSIKTLAITISIISFLPNEFGDGGLMSLPLIIGHLCLLLFDSVWVTYWGNATKEEKIVMDVEISNCENNHDGTMFHVTSV